MTSFIGARARDEEDSERRYVLIPSGTRHTAILFFTMPRGGSLI
jgi:hypothetical protein